MISKPAVIQNLSQDKSLTAICLKLDAVIDALNARSIPPALAEAIQGMINSINNQTSSKKLVKELNRTYKEVLSLVEKELRWVPKHHHRNLWMALGMSAFGLPIGIVFSMTLHSYAFIGIGLPVGMAIGIAVGTSMDRKAALEGRQLNIE